MARYVIAADCGTTSVRSLAVDVDTGRHQVCSSEPVALSRPRPGWVEIDAEEIAQATVRAVRAAFEWAGQDGGSVVALGNHSFFFGSKLAWLLDTQPEVRTLADQGDLAAGTLESWVLHRLTGGAVHATDVSNASRYQFLDLKTLTWDDELCERLGVPRAVLPEVRPSEYRFGTTDADVCGLEVPITGILADQQASLFGHGCEDKGDVKATFGTSGVVALNTGSEPVLHDGLIACVGWEDGDGNSCYEIEGSAFHSGYTVGWLKQRFGDAAAEPSPGRSARDPQDRVYVLPSFSELGAPRWPTRRGAVVTGLGMDTRPAEILAAACEAMAFQAYDLFAAMGDVGSGMSELVVDGGGAANDEICQLLADLFGCDVVRPDNQELTSVGAAKAALRGIGEDADRWFGQDRSRAQRIAPSEDVSYAQGGYAEWVRLIETVLR